MAWTVGTPVTASGATAATNHVFAAPSSIVNGDILFCCLTIVGSSTTTDPGAVTLPNGRWATIASAAVTSTGKNEYRYLVAYCVAASESGTYTFSWTNSSRMSGSLVVLHPPAAPAALDTFTVGAVVTTTSVTAPALTGLAGTTDILVCTYHDPGGDNPYGVPAAMTTIFNANEGSSNLGQLANSWLGLSSNSSSAQTFTTSFSGVKGLAISVAFKPASGTVVTWLPTSGQEDRPPSSAIGLLDAGSTFFRSPQSFPPILLPTTGQEDRPLPAISRIDQPAPWFVRSPNPVPTTWLPTTGEEDRPPAQKRPPDEPLVNTYFIRSPNPVPRTWLPTTGEEDRPPVLFDRYPDPYQVYLPVFIAPPLQQFMAQTNADDFNPIKLPVDQYQAGFFRAPFAQAVGISGIAWWRPVEVLVGPKPPTAEWNTQWRLTPLATPVGISGMAWHNPPETRPPPFRPDPYNWYLPEFIAPPLQQFMAQTNADDFNPLPSFKYEDQVRFAFKPPVAVVTPPSIGWMRADVPVTQFFFILT